MQSEAGCNNTLSCKVYEQRVHNLLDTDPLLCLFGPVLSAP
jgi:hypothetical protein